MKKARIFYGGYLKNGGGVVTHIMELEKYLLAKNVAVKIVSMDCLGIFEQALIIGAQKLFAIFSPLYAYKVRMILSKNIYKKYLGHDDFYFMEDYIFSYKENRDKELFFLHAIKYDNMQDFNLNKRALKKFLEWEVNSIKPNLNATYTVSDSYADYLREVTSLKDIKVFNNFKFVDMENYSFVEKDLKTILFVGNFESRKNPLFLLNVLNEIKEEFQKAYFIGREISITIDDLNDKILELELNNKVEVLGQQTPEQLQTLMAKSCILALPSLKESFGFVFLEAKLNYMHVITTAGLEVPNHLVDIFSELDVKSWSNSMRMLLEQPHSNKIPEDILKNFTQQYVDEKLKVLKLF